MFEYILPDYFSAEKQFVYLLPWIIDKLCMSNISAFKFVLCDDLLYDTCNRRNMTPMIQKDIAAWYCPSSKRGQKSLKL